MTCVTEGYNCRSPSVEKGNLNAALAWEIVQMDAARPVQIQTVGKSKKIITWMNYIIYLKPTFVRLKSIAFCCVFDQELTKWNERKKAATIEQRSNIPDLTHSTLCSLNRKWFCLRRVGRVFWRQFKIFTQTRGKEQIDVFVWKRRQIPREKKSTSEIMARVRTHRWCIYGREAYSFLRLWYLWWVIAV